MKNFIEILKKYKIIIYVILVIVIAVGIYLFFKGSINNNLEENQIINIIDENIQAEEDSNNETTRTRTVAIKDGDKNLENQVREDEEKYGDNYQKFTNCEMTYKRKPDRIYFKKANESKFYVFEKNEENYNHLVQVAEDRMAYASMEDFNLWAFTPVSINSMVSSDKIYIVFDYDNGTAGELDYNYNKDIIFTFNENTRLYRLLSYLSSNKESVSKDNLPKKEFATDTNISGYKYMMYDIMD